MPGGSGLRADVVRPSALGAGDRKLWQSMQSGSCSLQRAFLTPTYAEACERANGRTYVIVLHDAGSIRGFFPIQFRTTMEQCLRLAERVGGEMSDASGLIADPDLRISPPSLLRLARLSALSMTHLTAGQEQLGMTADWSQIGHIMDLRDGTDAYFAALLKRDRVLVRDTERRLRKAEARFGALRFTRTECVSSDMIAAVVEQKRQQYHRTQADDVLATDENVRLLAALNDTPAPDCRLVLSRLEAGNRVLAQHLGLQYNDVLSHWFPVYDPEAHNVSPGRLLLWHMVLHAAKDGTRIIDFGQGDAVYKREFATTTTHYGQAQWYSGGTLSVLAQIYQGLEWRLRPVRGRHELATL